MSDLFAGAGRADSYDEVEIEDRTQPVPIGPAELAARGVDSAAQEEAVSAPVPLPQVPPGYATAAQVRQPISIVRQEPQGASFTQMAEQARPELLTGQQRTPPATWGWRGFLVRATGGLWQLSAGTAERAHLEAARVVRQARWDRSVNVLVANKCGGVGKTTTALILAGTLAEERGSVAVVEVSDAPGSLDKRAEGGSGRGLGELLREIGPDTTAGALGAYVSSQTSRADVIGSTRDRPVLEAEDVSAVRTILDQHYRMTVADSGNSPHSSAHSRAIDVADVLVVPTLLSSVSVLDAFSALQVAAERSQWGRRLAENAVIVINHDGRPEPTAAAARQQLAQLVEVHPGVTVTEVPYDSHVNHGGPITLASLTATSRQAWTQVAATVIDKLTPA